MDAYGDPDGHGRDLIPGHESWLGQVIAEQRLTDEPNCQRELLMLFQPGTLLVHTRVPAALPDRTESCL